MGPSCSVYLQYMNSALTMCLYGPHMYVLVYVCWVHRSTDVSSPYGGQVGLSQNSPLCGDLAATLSLPSHSCMNDVAPHMWCCLSFCLWVFDCTSLSCVCVGVCAVIEHPACGNIPCQESVCVSLEQAYGHGHCHQPVWLRLLLPFHRLLDYSRCHIGTDGETGGGKAKKWPCSSTGLKY